MAKPVKKPALGRGLSALLNDDSKESSALNTDLVREGMEIPIEQIETNPFQPRSYFSDEALQELAVSIEELGVIQPITVRKIKDKEYQLISGERRLRASKLLGNETIPAYIRIANDQQLLEMALVENIQREDLDPIEVALTYQRMIDELNLTQVDMSSRVGKKRSTISNYLRLLKLDPIIQTGMRDGFLSMGHGRALINIEDTEKQLEIYEQIIEKKLSVRQTEQLVQGVKERKPVKETKDKEIPVFIEEGINQFSSYFGQKVDIKYSGKGKGKITLPFHSEEDFNRLIKLIK